MNLAIGTRIRLHSQQVPGYYLNDDGTRSAHFAVPGVYEVVTLEQYKLVMRQESTGDLFECLPYHVQAILGGWSAP